jgi:hypothetical protein
MKTTAERSMFVRAANLGLVTLISLSLLANAATIPSLPDLLAGSMSKEKAFLRRSLDGQFVDDLTRSLNVEISPVGGSDALETALETAVRKLNAGKAGNATTTEALANSLSGKTAHGDLFETLAARSVKASYTRPNNPGVDYQRFDSVNRRMIFSQAKATSSATESVHKALIDSLEFIGKDPDIRAGQLTKGKTLFEAVIPADQYDKLVRQGAITAEGKVGPKLTERVLNSSAKLAKETGESAGRIRAALPQGRIILSHVVVARGPVSYSKLLELTAKARNALVGLSKAANKFLRAPIVNAAGKTLGVVGVAVSAPIMVAQLNDLDARRAAGEVLDENVDKETFAIYGTAGLGAGIGVALLMFTPAGWVGIGVAGAGMAVCWLVDDGCFQSLYEKVIQTEDSKRAFAELRRIRGERAAHLSGFTIHPDMIIDVNERGSYELAWKNAGSPAPVLPDHIKDRAFEANDTRLGVDSQPTEGDILRYRLIPSGNVSQKP